MFQQTVVNKYLKSLDQEKLNIAWDTFQAHFHNPQIQENIRNSKEEQYQGEFLIDLFVNVLGYTKNPAPGFNLTTELKNTQDSKKADGAIVINDVTKAVIELKGTKTTDLTKAQEQAFNYKTSHKGCDVVIISNFEKLRLFIRNQTEYQEFNLFTLDKAQFDLLYLLLAYDYFEKNLLIKIKDESLSQEEEITKKLYKDYSDFKRELFQDLVKQNPQFDALTLFKSSQKLLDRFLFLFFAEDRGLLPPNAVREILRQWKKLQELDAYDTLINRFRKYFGYLNTGFKGKKYDVFAYNGGLFAADEVLDHVEISDDILYQYTQQLADYDYQSEVDVNILGHIFENSLNEIEEVRADLEGETVDKSKTKRKKDGVFYTPKYITQYIVENTVGKLCEEKKAELDLKDEDYDPGQNYQKKTIAKLEDKLVAYYDWLTALTICDPACGSGAFLNQALDFLIKEHEYLTTLRQNLYVKNGQIAMAFPFSENDILENNLYGVDINEESVEIAKLSLWLRTAKPNRKLNSLSENIKVGNSLIDDPEVAGDKAFIWEKEFPQVFKEKDLEAFHVVLTTHNSRTSQRMRELKIEKGEGIYWNLEQEIILAQIFSEIIQEKGFRCIAFNICRDHVHLILVCELNEISEIVRTIKGKSAYLYNRRNNVLKSEEFSADNGLKPIGDTSKGLQPLDSKESNDLKPDEVSADNGLKPIGDLTGNGLKPVRDSSKGLQPLASDKSKSLWTQKFYFAELDNWEIYTQDNKHGYSYGDHYIDRAISYIQNNREKHELPTSKKLDKIIAEFVMTKEEAFTPEYKGGFDVVIGNPPYVRKQGLMLHYPEMTEYYESNFKSATGNYDIYALFMERSYGLINISGIVSFILPHKFLIADFGEGIRAFFKEKKAVKELLHFGSHMVFDDASTYTCIINLDKQEKDRIKFKKLEPIEINNPFGWDYMLYDNFSEQNWDLQSQKVFDLIEKLRLQPYTIDKVFDRIFVGLQTSLDAVYVFEGVDHGNWIKGYNTKYDYQFEIEKEIVKPFIKGNEISKYLNLDNNYYVLFPYTEEGVPVKENYIKDNLPKTYEYLKHFESEIRGRERGRMDIEEDWYLYIYPKNLNKFHHPKIMTQEISSGCNMTYDEKGEFYHPTTIYSFVKKEKFQVDEKFYLGIMNSKVLWFFIKNTGTELRGGYFRFKTNYLKPFPLPSIPDNPEEIIENVNRMLSLNKELQEITDKFLRTLDRKFEIEKLSKKLEAWHDLTYKEFVKELKKKKVKLSLAEEAEWEDYFTAEKTKADNLKTQINQTDKEIDDLVYDLYGLTEEEIEIVENS